MPIDSMLLDSIIKSTSNNDIAAASNQVAAQNDTPLSKIGVGVRYTKTLILYYHATIVAILALVALQHWLQKLIHVHTRRHASQIEKRRRTAALQQGDVLEEEERALIEPSADEIVSSGSSTLTVSTVSSAASRGKLAADERSPLIQKQPARKYYVSLWRRARATLMYQPPLIPILNRQPSENGTTLFILLLSGISLFFLFFRCPLEFDSIFVLADRASMLFVASLPYLYILGAKNQPLRFLTGRSYESLNIFHRRLGEWLCLLALVHGIGMVCVWYSFLRPAGWSFVYFLGRKIIILGLAALACYELLYITSLGTIRQRLYEFFLASHIILQAAALPLLFFHHKGGGIYVGIAAAIWLCDRLLFRLTLKTRSFLASFEVLDERQGWLRIRCDMTEWIATKRSFMSRRYGWHPLQHAFVSIPSLRGSHALQAHPFTIASTPDETRLDLLVKAHDGFTRDIFRYTASHYSGTVRLDGFYGTTHALDIVAQKDSAIIVAAGTGLAVAVPLIQELLRRERTRKDVERVAQDHLPIKITLVVVLRTSALLQVIKAQYLDGLEQQGVQLVVPPPTEEGGRPDMELILKGLMAESSRMGSIGVVCSAPDGMDRVVRNFCAQQVWYGADIDVTVEKYGW